jgi:hypothetical protein
MHGLKSLYSTLLKTCDKLLFCTFVLNIQLHMYEYIVYREIFEYSVKGTVKNLGYTDI